MIGKVMLFLYEKYTRSGTPDSYLTFLSQIYCTKTIQTMTFQDYLVSKKINSEKFRNAEPLRWEEWNMLFAEMHPANFTRLKLNLINAIRRAYLLTA
jgi:hypothetical protein